MCVFLLLSGKTRYVPDAAHVRVHQIWMGDRADDARAASYTAQDLMIVERDIGRLAKFTFDMGGTGDLLVAGTERAALGRSASPVARRIAADQSGHHRSGCRRAAAATRAVSVPMADAKPKPTQDRFVSSTAEEEAQPQPAKSTKTAEAHVPTGGANVAPRRRRRSNHSHVRAVIAGRREA